MSEQSPGYWWLPPGAPRVAQGSVGGRGIAGCDEMSGFTHRREMEGTGSDSEDEALAGAYSYSQKDPGMQIALYSPR